MMYHDNRPRFGMFHLVIGLLALIGFGWLLLSVARPRQAQLSLWSGGSRSAASVQNAAGQGGLTGITTEQMGQTGQGMPFGDPLRPVGNPLQTTNSVVTQGYGVGSHAPAETWGGIDIAVDGNGDGAPDPQGTLGTPVYATCAGVVKLARDTWPAGNHIWVSNDQYRTGYAHLLDFAVENGQQVQPGTLIGYVGSTGQSSGPHLHYDVWEKVDGAWVNRNPFDFGGADGAK